MLITVNYKVVLNCSWSTAFQQMRCSHCHKYRLMSWACWFSHSCCWLSLRDVWWDQPISHSLTYASLHTLILRCQMDIRTRKCIRHRWYGEMGWSQHKSPHHALAFRRGLYVLTCAEMSPGHLEFPTMPYAYTVVTQVKYPNSLRLSDSLAAKNCGRSYETPRWPHYKLGHSALIFPTKVINFNPSWLNTQETRSHCTHIHNEGHLTSPDWTHDKLGHSALKYHEGHSSPPDWTHNKLGHSALTMKVI